MLDVRFGDRGPRVVLLQVLLNRRGAGLVVDGGFGRHARQAVIGYRRKPTRSWPMLRDARPPSEQGRAVSKGGP